MKYLICSLLLLAAQVLWATSSNIDKTDEQADMLTPAYYTASADNELRQAIDSFIVAARQIPFSHPLSKANGEQTNYTVHRDFGDGMGGANNDAQHHPAVDMYVGNKASDVLLFGVIDGTVNTYYGAAKYRDYITITQTIKNKEGKALGSIMVIYGHVDLDLDTLDGRYMDGKEIHLGDTISTHLYANTMGGPHLHFEVRYYRPEDTPPTEFYGINPALYTSASSAPWPYGRWNTEIGYGYGHPENHFHTPTTTSLTTSEHNGLKCFPNPSQGKLTLDLNTASGFTAYRIVQTNGKQLQTNAIYSSTVELDLSPYPNGIYIIHLEKPSGAVAIKVIKQ